MEALSEQDMIDIKNYFIARKLMQNTLATRLSYVVAVVKYAMNLKVINANPIPPKYVPSFVDSNRQVLTESECLRFISIDDDTIPLTERIAKYCLIVQMLTGIGYGDLKDVAFENIKNTDYGYFLEKN